MLEKNDAIKTPAECADCPHVEFCKRCPGLLASESGDPEKVSETFCAVAADLHRLYDELKAKEAQLGAEEATASSDGE
jgi:sulfatase maturation enzyme AslB (radical SAM superfamily)